LATVAEQPKINEMIATLEKTDGPFAAAYKYDAAILKSFVQYQSHRQYSLKDFLFARCQKPASQNLDTIIDILKEAQTNKDKIHEIDESHLLTNLLHAMFNGTDISIYDLSTILEHYVVLKMFANKPELKGYKLEFVTDDTDNAAKPKEDSLKIWQQKIQITKQDSKKDDDKALVHKLRDLDGLNTFYFMEDYSKEVNGDFVYYTQPTAMLARKILSSSTSPYELPLPMLLCYNYEIMQHYMCQDSKEVSWRPVTLPTLLPLSVRNLFKGVKAVYGDAKYVAYNLNADPNKPLGLRDLVKVHGTSATHVGVVGHDHIHVLGDNQLGTDALIIRNTLSRAIEANPAWAWNKLTKAADADPQALSRLKFRQDLLDIGVIGSLQNHREFLQGNGILPEIINMLKDPEHKKIFIDFIKKVDIPIHPKRRQLF
jgi:hypothetical protein